MNLSDLTSRFISRIEGGVDLETALALFVAELRLALGLFNK